MSQEKQFLVILLLLWQHRLAFAVSSKSVPKVLPANSSYPADEEYEGVISSCIDLPHSDQSLLQPDDGDQPFWVSCVHRHQLGGTGWLVIMQRVDASLSFTRSWAEYKEGFGSLSRNFWLGLENVHRLTSKHRYELLVEGVDYTGLSRYGRYSRFAIGNEASQYAVEQLGTYTGSGVDGFSEYRGRKFSTFDNDNDKSPMNCAVKWTGGWWFDNCYKGTFLTGRFVNNDKWDSMVWLTNKGKWKSCMYARMMIRKLN